ncbi:MAG: glutamine synthetase III [Phycisphaerae bacterium]|nr:glutamine synthetase III [Phycisphaerae bacterium]
MCSDNQSLSNVFGCQVFNDTEMRARLPKNVYKQLKETMIGNNPLDPSIADVVANAVKDWAIEKGATHYTHWFHPMTGSTAEKHDSFISPTSDGRIIMEFSGKELIKGEPDASSFPSGGLRVTFEARGYTAWDCTSPVFVKRDGDNTTMFIPSAFCSYTGQALDKKTPLLRSMDVINKQSLRVLRSLGNETSNMVYATLGAEQEYFLIDREFHEKRLDLLLTGRTLLGAASPRGQEMADHYFGSLDERIASYMAEVNQELWALGVTAKTQHNEVAPGQFEIAPVFSTVNVANDHNHLTMETLQKIAKRHGLICLIHEKPFAGVNGSGKHHNWSLATDDGINLLDPGSTPHENMIFMVFLCAVIKAVNNYSGLLRSTVASPGNDHRLGGHEAPPAIISMFLGEQLNDIIEQIKTGGVSSSKSSGNLQLGVSTLPQLPTDCSDRNRTSPFAFTGNRFEFRMPGSTVSPAGPTFVFNTIVADALSDIADELEKAEDINTATQKLLKKIIAENERIIFNGDNYSEDWVAEAEKRGLPNLKKAPEALKYLTCDDNVELFEKFGILSKAELVARHEILLETYSKTINIEARTMLDMLKRQVLPCVMDYCGTLAAATEAIKASGLAAKAQSKKLNTIAELIDGLSDAVENLENQRDEAEAVEGTQLNADAYSNKVIPAMAQARTYCDKLETIVDADVWPLPTYAQMMFLK